MPVFALLKLVPSWAYKLIALALVCLGIFMAGEHHVQKQWDTANAVAKAHAEVVETKREAVSAVVEQKEKVAEEKIRTVYKDRVIYKEKVIPHEVIVKEDSECTISNRFVSMWNSANSVQVPDSTGEPDESPSDVKLSDVETQHERESEINALNVEQIRAWQEWAKQQGLVK